MYIPAPKGAVFEEIVQFVIVGDESLLQMEPPLFVAVFAEIEQVAIVGEDFSLKIAPPQSAVFSETVQLLMVGNESLL